MFDEWTLLLAVTVLLAIQTLRVRSLHRGLGEIRRLVDHLNKLLEENAAATKEMNDLILEKMPHLKAEVEAGMEQWKKDNEPK